MEFCVPYLNSDAPDPGLQFGRLVKDSLPRFAPRVHLSFDFNSRALERVLQLGVLNTVRIADQNDARLTKLVDHRIDGPGGVLLVLARSVVHQESLVGILPFNDAPPRQSNLAAYDVVGLADDPQILFLRLQRHENRSSMQPQSNPRSFILRRRAPAPFCLNPVQGLTDDFASILLNSVVLDLVRSLDNVVLPINGRLPTNLNPVQSLADHQSTLDRSVQSHLAIESPLYFGQGVVKRTLGSRQPLHQSDVTRCLHQRAVHFLTESRIAMLPFRSKRFIGFGYDVGKVTEHSESGNPQARGVKIGEPLLDGSHQRPLPRLLHIKPGFSETTGVRRLTDAARIDRNRCGEMLSRLCLLLGITHQQRDILLEHEVGAAAETNPNDPYTLPVQVLQEFWHANLARCDRCARKRRAQMIECRTGKVHLLPG